MDITSQIQPHGQWSGDRKLPKGGDKISESLYTGETLALELGEFPDQGSFDARSNRAATSRSGEQAESARLAPCYASRRRSLS
jgi:hypothetical protein